MRHVCKWSQSTYDKFDEHVVPGDIVVCVTGDYEVIYVAIATENWQDTCSDCALGYPGCTHYAFSCDGIHLRKPSSDMEEL